MDKNFNFRIKNNYYMLIYIYLTFYGSAIELRIFYRKESNGSRTLLTKRKKPCFSDAFFLTILIIQDINAIDLLFLKKE